MYVSMGKIVSIMRKEYHKWVLSLTVEERRAIRKYTRNTYDLKRPYRFFERLNSMLRGEYNMDDRDMLEKYAEIISGDK